MSNIQIYKKPELAILEEQLKVRDYSEENFKITASNLVYKLLMMLGVGNGNEEHHIELIKFIKQTAGKYTFEEINKAFEMYVSHEFETKVFQQLNAVVFGNVMNFYDIYKAEKLRNYRLKKAKPTEEIKTEEEIKSIMELAVKLSFEEYKEKGKLTGITHHIYDYLDKNNIINTTDKRKKEIYEIAKKEISNSLEFKKKFTKNRIDHAKAINDIVKLNNNKNNDVISLSKRIAIEEHFKLRL